MAELIPYEWRRSLGRLRDDITAAVRRWLPGRNSNGEQDADQRYPSPLFSSTLFSGGPQIELEETDNDVIVTAELPGFDEGDFNLDLTEKRLLLRGEKKHSREEKKAGYYYSKRSYGSFVRPIPLPCEVDVDRAKARFKNGLLRVTLPKTERARARRVKVRIH